MFRLRPSVIIHIVAWLIFFMLPFILMPGGPADAKKITAILGSYSYWATYSLYIFLFYFNAYFLIPKLYLNKKYIIYTAVVLAILAGIYFFKHWIDSPMMSLPGEPPGRMPFGGRPSRLPLHDSLRHFHDSLRHFFHDSLHHFRDSLFPGARPQGAGPFAGGRASFPRRQPVDLYTIFLISTIWALSTAIRITQQWRETEKRAIKAEADKANAELSFLKAQINPHFLFNTLNNIYSLAVKQNEATAASIMKLSNIMRYVTDDVNQDFVSLQSEVECITDYIDLQRLRLNKKVFVDFSVTGNTEGKKIPPLVLMTFIENVFKYGISSHEESTITIKLFAEEKSITFFCQNKLFSTQRRVERTGIGITNTRQRLEHVYPNRHLLNITSENGFYTVQLTIQV